MIQRERALSIVRVGRAYRHAQRYRQILSVLFRHGFDELLRRSKIEEYVDSAIHLFGSEARAREADLSLPERVRTAVVELGPTFVKMGQVLSTRPDLLPMEFVRELAKLQDDVPPFPFAEAKRIVEEELGRPLGEIYSEFDETPIAAASIGQVHRARLPGGEEVAVKVQRPDVRATVEVDLEIMMHLATLMETHIEGMSLYSPTKIVEEFAATIEREMNYEIEAGHMERFAHDFAGETWVRVPKVFRAATARRALTMEFVRGAKVNDPAGLAAGGHDPKRIAERGADLILRQVFVHGFFHADPHPGNIFVLPGDVVCLIDFGMVGRIGRRKRYDFADLVAHVVRRDEVAATACLLRLTTSEVELDTDRLERDMAAFMDHYLYRPLKEIDFSALLQELFDVAARHRLRVDPNVALMLKALATVQAIATTLHPELDIAAHAIPFLRRLRIERMNPRRLAAALPAAGAEIWEAARDLPGDLRTALRALGRGRVGVEIHREGVEPALASLAKASNRLAFAIVLAGLLIGSSVIVLSGVPPTWRGIPVIGLAGYVLSGAMGGWLLIAFLKGGML